MTATQLPAGLQHRLDIAILVIGGRRIYPIAHHHGEVDPRRPVPGAARILVKVSIQQPVHSVIPKSIGPLLSVTLTPPFRARNIAIQLVRTKTPVIAQFHTEPPAIPTMAIVIIAV